MSGAIPRAVLSEALQEAIARRPVRAAVFTTFSFDPGFFEAHVLTTLFPDVSLNSRVARLQLEDALTRVDEVAVYYDRTALSQDAEPARLDVRRVDVRRSTGVFHPKVVLVLVEDTSLDEEDPPLALVVGTLSANLTRAGWWENVEGGHFEELRDKDWSDERIPYRRDLLGLIRQIRNSARLDENQVALDRIEDFVRRRTIREEPRQVSVGGTHYTRLFYGQSSFPEWLRELNLGRHDWNLEVISPYFDARGNRTLQELVDALQPKSIRVFLPEDGERKALVSEELYDDVAEIADWARLPSSLTKPIEKGTKDRARPRFVHAKVYRLWEKGGRDISIVGSVNLTRPAHSTSRAGNLEAAFLFDRSADSAPRQWWLSPVDHDPEQFGDANPDEREGIGDVPVDIVLRFAWTTKTLDYYLDEDAPRALSLHETSGPPLFELSPARPGRWRSCGEEAAERIETLLESTSFISVRHGDDQWRVLVREEGMAQKPSLVRELTPEDILLYWSLLSPEQREAFISEKLLPSESLEGLPQGLRRQFDQQTGMFERFAGIYHAFEALWRSVETALEQGHEREANARLFGAKYDSLPNLLERTRSRVDDDPIVAYVTFLCAQQLRDRTAKDHRDFWRAHRTERAHLEGQLAALTEIRARVAATDGLGSEFLDWYEDAFLRQAPIAEETP